MSQKEAEFLQLLRDCALAAKRMHQLVMDWDAKLVEAHRQK
ncbi:hypothetical protein [Burkholderia cenocepacia]|nr:hypothetical protein [Burkholderia cenocepacia]